MQCPDNALNMLPATEIYVPQELPKRKCPLMMNPCLLKISFGRLTLKLEEKENFEMESCKHPYLLKSIVNGFLDFFEEQTKWYEEAWSY